MKIPAFIANLFHKHKQGPFDLNKFYWTLNEGYNPSIWANQYHIERSLSHVIAALKVSGRYARPVRAIIKLLKHSLWMFNRNSSESNHYAAKILFTQAMGQIEFINTQIQDSQV